MFCLVQISADKLCQQAANDRRAHSHYIAMATSIKLGQIFLSERDKPQQNDLNDVIVHMTHPH